MMLEHYQIDFQKKQQNQCWILEGDKKLISFDSNNI